VRGERIGPLFAELLGAQGKATPCDIATSATHHTESRNVASVARVPGFTHDLERRLLAMAARWEYTADDLAHALEDARQNPTKWLACCSADEALANKLGRAGMRFLG
jgi:hypothetical protein